MSKPTADKVIKYAAKFVRPKPYKAPNMFTRWFYGNNTIAPYCAIFVYYCLAHTGGKELMSGCKNKAYCPSIWNWAKAKGYTVSKASKAKKGDLVLIASLGSEATLLEEPDKSGNVRVRAGILTTRVNIKDLRLKEDEPKVISGDKKIKASSYSVTRTTTFRDEIDLRGMTGDEAWLAVDKYFDEATLANVRTLRLIHGKGTGALKTALWKFLKGDKRISSFRIGQFGEGDGGVTIVELK